MMNRNTIIYLSIIVFCTTAAVVLLRNAPFVFDEKPYYFLIKRFTEKDFRLSNSITAAPGYHVFMALMVYLTGISSLDSYRLLSSVFSLSSVIVVFLLAKKIRTDSPVKTSLEFYFFPILFPFFFLIFTDVFSLLLVLLSLYALITQRRVISGILIILSMAVRQTNIIWLIFMCLLIYAEDYSKSLDLSLSESGLKIKFEKEMLKSYLREIWIYILGFILFAAFVIVNKGVAMGDKAKHPSASFHMGNIYFILFLFFFLFLPLNISNFTKIVQFVKKNKIVIFIVAIGALLNVFTWRFTFKYCHPYNIDRLCSLMRNEVLYYVTSYALLKGLFFLIISYSFLSLTVTKLYQNSMYFLYPMTIINISLIWLIEPRYYFVPFTLFILFKENSSKLVEYITISYYVILSFVYFITVTKFGYLF